MRACSSDKSCIGVVVNQCDERSTNAVFSICRDGIYISEFGQKEGGTSRQNRYTPDCLYKKLEIDGTYPKSYFLGFFPILLFTIIYY